MFLALMFMLGFVEFYFAIPLALVFGFALLQNPRLWMSVYVLAIGPYLSTGGAGVSAIEVVLAAGLNGGLLVWLLGYKFVGKERYIRGISEYLFIAFHVLVILNMGIAYLNDVPLFDWVRVYLRISLVFYYIPLRIYFKTEKDIRSLLKLLAVVSLNLIVYHLYVYYNYATQMEMAYQIGKGVREHLGILSTMIAVMIGLLYSIKTKLGKSFVAMLLVLTLISMVTTFARAYWVTTFMGIVLLLFFLKPSEKIATVSMIMILSIITVIALQIILGDIWELAVKAISDRASSTTKGSSDVSFMMRLVEYDEAFKQISMYPMGGKGFASRIDFYIPQVMQYWDTHNIHNSFLYTVFKTGIPMTLLYVSGFLLFFLRSIISIFRQTDTFHKYLAVGITCGFITVFFASFISNNFFERDAVILISFLIFFSSYLYYRKEPKAA